MRKAIFFVFLSWLCFSVSGRSLAEVVDKILVVVNDEIITQGEVDRILAPIFEQYKGMYTGDEFMQKFGEARKTVIERLVNDKLLLSEAKRKKIEVEDKEVEAKIDEARGRFRSEKEFERALEQENIVVGDLGKRYRERIMVDRLIDMELRKNITVTPGEIVTYYEGHADEFEEPKKVKLRSMLIRINEKHSEEEALKLAEGLLKRLEEGGDFGELARAYSEDPYAAKDGDMGWVKEGELMGKINELVFGMEKDQISGVLKTNLGFHIFKVEDKMNPKKVEFQDAKKEIEKIILNKKLDEKIRSLIERLKKDAYIAFR